MTQLYRGSANQQNNRNSDSIKLTVKDLDGIDFDDVIYGERSQSGAMGNAGGVMREECKELLKDYKEWQKL